jgi:hypothetical protein
MTCTDGLAKVVVGKPVWAIHPFIGEKAHHWNVNSQSETVFGIRSMCGIESVATSKVPLLNPGDWPKCNLCGRKKR